MSQWGSYINDVTLNHMTERGSNRRFFSEEKGIFVKSTLLQFEFVFMMLLKTHINRTLV